MIHTPGRVELDTSWLCEDDEEDWLTSTDDGDDYLGSATFLHSTLSGYSATSLSADLALDDSDDEQNTRKPPSELVQKIRSILSSISDAGLTLGSFLHAISWGNRGCVGDPQIRNARTALMSSPELPIILKHWWMPPHSAVSWKSCTHGAHLVMVDFSVKCLQSTIIRELNTLCDRFWTPDDVQEDFFTGTHFTQLAEQCKTIAPTLWRLLLASAHTKQQADRNTTKKNPSKVTHLFLHITPTQITPSDCSHDYCNVVLHLYTSCQLTPEAIFYLPEVSWSVCKGI